MKGPKQEANREGISLGLRQGRGIPRNIAAPGQHISPQQNVNRPCTYQHYYEAEGACNDVVKDDVEDDIGEEEDAGPLDLEAESQQPETEDEPVRRRKQRRGRKRSMRVKHSTCAAAAFVGIDTKAFAFFSAVCATPPKCGLLDGLIGDRQITLTAVCPATPPACVIAGSTRPTMPGPDHVFEDYVHP